MPNGRIGSEQRRGQATFPGEEKVVRINFAARGEDLVQLVHLVCLVSLVYLVQRTK
jgi:hypothetical protein